MYVIIKKDKAEHFVEKLHKMKAFACEIMEELELARETMYELDELHTRERSRRSGHEPFERERYEEPYREPYREHYHDREMARGRMGRGRY